MADSTRTLQIILQAKDEASQVVKGFSSRFKDLASEAKVGAAIIAASLGVVVKNAVQTASDFQQARVAFEGFLKSGEKAGNLLEQLSDFAVNTPFDLPQVVDGAKSLLAYGVAAEDVVKTFRMLGDLSQGNTLRLDRLTLAFGQVKAATRLTGAELRQFTEAGVPLLDTLAKQFGTTAAAVQDMISDRGVSFQDVQKALESLTSGSGRFADGMKLQAQTFGGVMSNIRDEFVRFSLEVMGFTKKGEIRDGSIFFYLLKGAKEFQKVLTEIRPTVTAFVDALLKNKTAILAFLGALVGLLIPLALAFISLIAPALAFIAVGAAVGAAIGFILQKLPDIQNFFQQFRDGFDNAVNTVKQKIEEIKTFFTELPQTVSDSILLMHERIFRFFIEDIPYAVGFAIGWLSERIPAIVESIRIWFETLPERTQAAWENLKQMIILKVTETWTWISNEISTWPTRILNFLKQIPPKVQEVLNQLIEVIKDRLFGGAESAWNKVQDFKDKVVGAFNAIVDAVSRAIDALKRGFQAGQSAGKVPSFQHGGFVPGGSGDVTPAYLHGGERVVPRNGVDVNPGLGGGGVNLTLNFTGSISLDSESRVKELADQIIRILGRQNELAGKGLGI